MVNSNAAWIAAACTRIGVTITAQTTVGDEEKDLIADLSRFCQTCDVILLTGGLGPTHDDITLSVLNKFTTDTFALHQPWLDHLHAWMKERGRELSERNAAQALVPSRATVLHNPIGTAPGVLVRHQNTIIVAMPGVPAEMRGIMTDHVLPLLQQRIDAEKKPAREYRVLQTTGIAESNLADLIGEPSQFLGTSTLAFLPNYQGVRLRIGALGTTSTERQRELDRITDILTERAGRFIYGVGERTLSVAVGERLQQRRETVAVAESCTGGLLGAAFTDVPGSSAWFEGGVLTYSNEAKKRELNVPEAVLNNVGAVSEAVAVLMAMKVREKFGTTWGIGVTGVAGPGGGTEEKPVGLVWIAVAGPDGVKAVKHLFGTDRRINRERTVGAALGMLWSQL